MKETLRQIEKSDSFFKTCHAGLQYRHEREGRGVQPGIQPPPPFQLERGGLTDRRIDKASYRVASP